jgi:hypothetical protein
MHYVCLLIFVATATISQCAEQNVSDDLLYIHCLTSGQLEHAEKLLQNGKVTADCSTLIMFGSIAGVDQLLRAYGAFNDCKAGNLQQIAFFLHNNALQFPEQRTTAVDIAQEILEKDICVHPVHSKNGNLLVDELSPDDPHERRLKELLLAAEERAHAAENLACMRRSHYWYP